MLRARLEAARRRSARQRIPREDLAAARTLGERAINAMAEMTDPGRNVAQAVGEGAVQFRRCHVALVCHCVVVQVTFYSRGSTWVQAWA